MFKLKKYPSSFISTFVKFSRTVSLISHYRGRMCGPLQIASLQNSKLNFKIQNSKEKKVFENIPIRHCQNDCIILSRVHLKMKKN